MPVLQILNGSLEGARVSFESGEPVVGKADVCDLVIPDAGVSRKHAKFFERDGSWHIEDVGSANGTFVNFVRKKAGEAVALGEGEILFVGRTVVKFYAGEPPAANDGGGGDAASAEELAQLRAELAEAGSEIDETRAELARAQAELAERGDGPSPDGNGAGAPTGAVADEESLRTLLRGTIPIHGLTCPKCATDLEEPFRALVREREQLEVVRRLGLHRLESKDLDEVLARARPDDEA